MSCCRVVVALGLVLALALPVACQNRAAPAESERAADATGDADVVEDSDAQSDAEGGSDAPHVPMGPLDFADVVELVRPAVVNIYTRTAPSNGEDAEPVIPPGMVPEGRVSESLGSGFIFDASGLVLTNDHVVADATEIAVRLLDERIYSAEVIGSDPPTDIAVLQLQDVDDDLPSIARGDSRSLRVGNWVLAIGNPLGLASTVTAGIASATGRRVMPPGGQLRFQHFIQTDASINPGSSGGPLINLEGEAIGIATAISSAGNGLGFAIPMHMVDEVLPDLLEYGEVERSWLGVYIGEVPDGLREELPLPDTGGVVLTRVVEEGPADEAGLQSGDVILELDGRQVQSAGHIAWLAATVGVGKTVDVAIVRGDEEMTLPLTMGQLPED